MPLKFRFLVGAFLPGLCLISNIAIAQTRFVETGGPQTKFVAIQAPASITTSYSLNFPSSDGAPNQCLATDGAGTLQWRTAGGTGYSLNAVDGSPVNAVYVDAAGNVGIGTTSPLLTLDVQGPVNLGAGGYTDGMTNMSSASTNDKPAVFVSGGGDGAGEHALYVLGRGETSFAADVLRVTANRSASTAFNLIQTVIDENGTPSMPFTVRGDGNVGIGTTSPTRLFQVGGAMKLTPVTVPATPTPGDMYVDSGAANTLKYHNGSAWVPLLAGGGDFMANGTVPMTAGIRAFAGTATAPGFAFNGDTNNGIFAPAADNIAIATSGSEKMRILANGNVGFGVSPTNTFEIFRNVDATSYLRFENGSTGSNSSAAVYVVSNGTGFALQMMGSTSNGGGIYQPGRAVLAADSGVTALAISNDGAKPILFGTSSVERMRVDSGGNVGIGTAAPSTLLDVRKDVASTIGPTLSLTNNGGGTNSGSSIDFNYPSATQVVTARIQSRDDGNWSSHLAFSTKIPGLSGNALAERLRIDSAGNVGIGQSSPGAKLDVAGTVRFGASGGIITNMGTCTFNQAVTTADASVTCTGVPASTSVVVHCSPTAALSAATGVVFRATGTVNQIALRGTAAAAAANWVCNWVQP